jgi:nucleoside recognition membrane protein YjiH
MSEASPKVLIPAGLGLFLFLTPLYIDQKFILPIAWMAKGLQSFLSPFMLILLGVTILCSFLFFAKKWKFKKKWELLLRFTSLILFSLMITQWGPSLLYSEGVGGLLLTELLPLLFCLFFIAGLTLPLLLEYGLVEFVGTLATPLMRPFFKLPGRAAIDCASSWLGDGSLGVMVSARQYKQGHYSQKEAAVIVTNFSLVSLTFTIVVVSQLKLDHLFGAFYFFVCLTSLSCALILPRLWPLAHKSDLNIFGEPTIEKREATSHSLLCLAYSRAIEKAQHGPTFKNYIAQGLQHSQEMLFSLIPIVLTIGTLALLIAEGTPLLTYLSWPLVPLLEFLAIEEAPLAAKALFVGIADMFLPALLATSIESETTRLLVGVVSVSQLIYFSEVGAMILAMELPLKWWELIVLFFYRTIISMLVLIPWFWFF